MNSSVRVLSVLISYKRTVLSLPFEGDAGSMHCIFLLQNLIVSQDLGPQFIYNYIYYEKHLLVVTSSGLVGDVPTTF